MAKGINISVASDTREFTKGVQTGVIKPLEGAADALDDLTQDGDAAGEKLEKALDKARDGADDLGDAGRDAGKKLDKALDTAGDSTDGLKKKQSELSKAVDDGAAKGGKSIGTNYKAGTDKAGQGMDDLKQEANQNAQEVASSFDGSAQSIADGFQGLAATAFAGFGPAGVIAGLAAAGGIGLISKALEGVDAASEETKAKAAELAQEYITTGDIGVTSLDFLVGRLQDLATETDGVNLAKLAKTAKESKSSFKDLALAYSGNADGLKDLVKNGESYLEQMRKEQSSTDITSAAGTKRVHVLGEQMQAQSTYLDYLDDAEGIAKKAAEAELNYANAGGPELERKAAAIASIQSEVDDATSSWDDYHVGETDALDPAAFLAAVAARTDAAAGYAANLATAQEKLSPEAYQYLIDQGMDFAPMLQSILDSGMTDQFNTTFTAAATAGNAAIDGTLVTDREVTVEVTPELGEAEKALKVTEDKDRATKVTAKADTTTAEADLKAAAGKTYKATITASVDLTAAEKALDRFIEKARSVKITATVVDRAGKVII